MKQMKMLCMSLTMFDDCWKSVARSHELCNNLLNHRHFVVVGVVAVVVVVVIIII